jgi:hypothetical protein
MGLLRNRSQGARKTRPREPAGALASPRPDDWVTRSLLRQSIPIFWNPPNFFDCAAWTVVLFWQDAVETVTNISERWVVYHA